MSKQSEIPANGRELQAIEYVAALDVQLMAQQKVLRERLRAIPDGWRRWRLAAAIIGKLLSEIYETLPMKNLKHMEQVCKHCEVLVRLKPVARQPGQVLAGEDDLQEIINAAMGAECAICLKEGGEVKGCRLRKALMSVMPPDELPEFGCAYRGRGMV